MYFINDSYLLSLSSWLVKLCIQTYFVICSMYTHDIYACGIRDTFIPYLHVDLRLFLNILIFKQGMMNEFMKQAKELEKGDDFTN